MNYQYIDLTYLNTISSGDKELGKTLMEMVQAELKAALPSLKQYLENQNWEEMHEASHKLKSTLAFVGNPALSQANQNILFNLEEKNYTAEYASWLATFQQLTPPILQEIRKALASFDA